MSRITEMVEEEAAAVEAETDTEAEASPFAGPENPVDPDDADDADEAPSSNVTVEKALASMEKENERHAKRVAQIMGSDFELVYPCSACADFAAGFTFTPPDSTPPLLHPAEYERCERCNGHGLVLTGAVSEIGRTQTCFRCNGQGYIEKPIQPVTVTPFPTQVQSSDQRSVADELRAQGYMVIDPPTQPRAV